MEKLPLEKNKNSISSQAWSNPNRSPEQKKTLRPAGLNLMAQLNLVVSSTSSSSLLYFSGRSYSWGSPQLATSNQGYHPWHKLYLFFPYTMLKRQLSEVQAYSKLSNMTLRPTSRVQSGLHKVYENPHPVESSLMIMVSFHLVICQRCVEGWVVMCLSFSHATSLQLDPLSIPGRLCSITGYLALNRTDHLSQLTHLFNPWQSELIYVDLYMCKR
ncbi:uncharacterized protein B0J16DRAFT_133156 [Fusarium flagelliforme]|uniref:uncharacterized protein n=1 Tax=Fusarium flagelliforme TaxID=2675880 RepID=UPI001E8D95CD|nr:uncharacterized protein B0J16DRAFT_133156 [Fusarium flagelliforme]KAH7185480.1 hypothetical protein B0J16DRAFT_133156 [Fusarium flagelliforme]